MKLNTKIKRVIKNIKQECNKTCHKSNSKWQKIRTTIKLFQDTNMKIETRTQIMWIGAAKDVKSKEVKLILPIDRFH